jgi:F-type H+-transporting ATPase subunit delta
MTSRAAATRYARALFDVVLSERGDVEAIQRDLQQFAELVSGHEALVGVFGNPGIPASRKHALAQALIERTGLGTGPLTKLILLLASRDRLVLLTEIATAYRARVMDHQKIIRGDVTSAVALPPEKLRALEEGLAHATGRRVMLEAKVDPSIIGGVVTRVGSLVYDGSVTTQLQKMKQALVEQRQ